MDQMRPKVSVCVVAYNQEKFIRQCLQSIVDQKTDFNFEVIVGDDCSTDGTREVIAEYVARYPHLIKAVFHDTNLGAVKNLFAVYGMAKGEYIAHLDGDDFAFPGKLKTQVDSLEAHPECFLCTHDVVVVDENSGMLREYFSSKKSGAYSIVDLYERLPFFAHSSKMFVNDGEFSSAGSIDRYHEKCLDIELHVAQAKKGKIYHIDCLLGAYRYAVGVSTSVRQVNPIFPQAIRRIFRDALKEESLVMSKIALRRIYARTMLSYSYNSGILGNRKDCRSYLNESICISPTLFMQPIIWLALAIPFSVPKVFRISVQIRTMLSRIVRC